MRNIAAGIGADGLGCLVGGLLGVARNECRPTLVSVEKTTGATSWVISRHVVEQAASEVGRPQDHSLRR